MSRTSFLAGVPAKISALLVLTTLMWATGFPSLIPFARAAAITSFSDTITNSDLGVATDHYFRFTTTASLDADDTIEIDFDPTGALFTIAGLVAADFTNESGIDIVAACGGGGDEATVSATADKITLTVCTGDAVTAGAITFKINNTRITSPGVASSYVIRLVTTNDGSAIRDRGDTRIAILDNVVVTASVDTIFTFTVSSVAENLAVNGDATNTATTTTATSIPFGTLLPGVPKVAAQTLSVATNARNGFTVTVVEDQNLTSQTGADIDLFIDGATTSVPVAWQSPASTLDSENTYGHIGVTTEDATLSDGDSFGVALYAGNIDAPREVFYHTGPADGTTANKGRTRVAYKVEIGSLQEAGNDYTNTLTYVATPIF